MKIELAVRHLGHVPSFKNKKRSVIRNGQAFPVTEKKTKKWMDQCIRSFESQLFSGSLTVGGVMLTGPHQQSLIASYLPSDDSRQWIPELHILCEDVDKGNEGAIIIIEPI